MSDFEKEINETDTIDAENADVTENVEEVAEEPVEETTEEVTEEPAEEPVEEAAEDDLIFISEESVRDKSKMATGKAIDDEMVSEKKTTRRSVDADEAKKEKSLKMAKKNLPFIIIGVVAAIVVIAILSVFVKNAIAKRAEQNKEQPVSVQEYETDQYEQINELFESYYASYAVGDTDSILQYAYPMSDSEKSYIQMYSEYVESYENITCYTKSLEDENSYIVSASFDVKLKGVDTTAPGMDTYYVTTAGDGSVYIDNTYSPFNRNYQEYVLNQDILSLIQSYEASDDVFALQAGVQTRYETVIGQDENLKNAVDVMSNAIAAWNAEHESELMQKAQEAAQQIQEQTPAEQPVEEAPPVEEPVVEAPPVEQPAQPQINETENKAWVYANDTVNIRMYPDENSEAVAAAYKNSEIRQLAITDNGWTKVKTGEIVGYIKSEYISTTPVQ